MPRDVWPLRPLAAALAASMVLSIEAPASASSAVELVRAARRHEQAQQDELALRRYTEALALDATCEEAYLGLGSLRARRGDLRESERVYSMALEHIPTLRAARVARAYIRRALGDTTGAREDLLTGAEATQHTALLHEARTMVRALVILVGTADPAAAPPDDGDRGLRRIVSRLAKRGGS